MTDTNGLAEALAALQGELPVITKNKIGKISGTSSRSGNEFNFEYKYADLAEVVEKVGPIASKHGLSFSAKPTNTEHGFVLVYALRHVSGEEDPGEWPLPDPRTNDPKQVGIAITYARRYVYTSMLGIVTEEDTDVKGAPEPEQYQPRYDERILPTDPRSKQQSDKMFAMFSDAGLDAKDRDLVLAYIHEWTGRDLETTKDLQRQDMQTIYDKLQEIIDDPQGRDPIGRRGASSDDQVRRADQEIGPDGHPPGEVDPG